MKPLTTKETDIAVNAAANENAPTRRMSGLVS
jgi:hypothetical protein